MGLTKAERAKKEMAESGVAEEGMVWGLVHLPYSLSILFLYPILEWRACS